MADWLADWVADWLAGREGLGGCCATLMRPSGRGLCIRMFTYYLAACDLKAEQHASACQRILCALQLCFVTHTLHPISNWMLQEQRTSRGVNKRLNRLGSPNQCAPHMEQCRSQPGLSPPYQQSLATNVTGGACLHVAAAHID